MKYQFVYLNELDSVCLNVVTSTVCVYIYIYKVRWGCQSNLIILEQWPCAEAGGQAGNMTQEKLYFWGRWWKQVSTRVVFHLFVLFYLLYHHAICLVSCPNMWIESYRVQVENILPKILLTVSTSARPKFY